MDLLKRSSVKLSGTSGLAEFCNISAPSFLSFAMEMILICLRNLDFQFTKSATVVRTCFAPLDRCISLIRRYISEEDISLPTRPYYQDFAFITAQMAEVFLVEGRLEEARTQFSLLIDNKRIREGDAWSDSEEAFHLLLRLATVCRRLGDLDRSSEIYASVIPLSKKLFGHDDERTATTYSLSKRVDERREAMRRHHKSVLVGSTDKQRLEVGSGPSDGRAMQDSTQAYPQPTDDVYDTHDDQASAELCVAASEGDTKMVRLFLGLESINPNYVGLGSRNALGWSALRGYIDIVQLLLERKGVEADFRDQRHKRTPLMWAIIGGHEAVARLLINRDNVNVNQRDVGGLAPLSIAAEEGHEEIIRLLLKRSDIKADLMDNDGRTPL